MSIKPLRPARLMAGGALSALGVSLAVAPTAAPAQQLTVRPADPTEQGSLSPEAARALIARGPLPFSAADVAAKAAADRAHADLARSGALQPAAPANSPPPVSGRRGPKPPASSAP